MPVYMPMPFTADSQSDLGCTIPYTSAFRRVKLMTPFNGLTIIVYHQHLVLPSRKDKPRTHIIIRLWELSSRSLQPQCKVPDDERNNSAQLHISKLFSNATMSTSSKWLIRRFSPFTDHSITVIHLFTCRVQFRRFCPDTFFVGPSGWIPCFGRWPDSGVHCGYAWGC